MRKRRVLAFFGALILFGIILGAMNFYNPNSVTAKAISSGSEDELFVGSVKPFSFQSSSFDTEGSKIRFKGTLSELVGEDHNIDLTVYAIDSEGVVSGQHKSSMFLASGDKVEFATNFNHEGTQTIRELIFYFDDGDSVVKGTYDAERKGITGNVINGIESGNGLVIYALLLASGIFFTVRYFSSHKKQLNFATSLGEPKSRQFINIDLR